MRFTRAGRASLAAAGGLAVAVLAAACTSSQTGTSATTASAHLEKTNLVVGSLPVVDTAGLFLAQQNGYFKQAGLNVTIKPISVTPQAIPDMEKGTVDIVAGANYVSFFQQYETKHLGLKVLADGESCSTDTFVSSSPVPSPDRSTDELTTRCEGIIKGCGESATTPSMRDCRATLAGMTEVGRDRTAACMTGHCGDKGLMGCEAAPTAGAVAVSR